MNPTDATDPPGYQGKWEASPIVGTTTPDWAWTGDPLPPPDPALIQAMALRDIADAINRYLRFIGASTKAG